MSYELQVVSQLPQFSGKTLKPWFVDGIDTIGVWGDEPFELIFKNRTGSKVQVRLSLDGTDILTGNKAHTLPNSDGMWVVDAYGTMSLKAWPETNQRGRSFLFGKNEASVAANTHGDMSSRGIIAAAVFTEGHVSSKLVYQNYGFNFKGILRGDAESNSRGRLQQDLSEVSMALPASAPAIGAGQEILQKISQATGLITPVLDRVVRMRYVWWDNLQETLLKQGCLQAQSHPTGFPGDQEKKLANLGSTPTVGNLAPAPKPPIYVQRFV